MNQIKQPVFLGIDTSCYSTSVALVDDADHLYFDRRILLPVEAGAKGLRQSQAFFYHSKNLPILIEELRTLLKGSLAGVLAAICVSEKPCRRDDSYMPVFSAGAVLARSLAAALNVPLIATTHQEGHLMAALWSAKLQWASPFLAFHLSGGTTELIQVHKIQPKPVFAFDYSPVLGTTDIPAG